MTNYKSQNTDTQGEFNGISILFIIFVIVAGIWYATEQIDCLSTPDRGHYTEGKRYTD